MCKFDAQCEAMIVIHLILIRETDFDRAQDCSLRQF